MTANHSEWHLSLIHRGQVQSVSGEALWQWQQQARQAAIAADIPVQEIDWLLREAAGLDGLTLRLGSYRQQAQVQAKLSLSELSQLWQRRVSDRVPVQYLVGVAPWRHFTLEVSPAVLIPRPETEDIVDLARSAASQSQNSDLLQQGHWADLGTGSGAIALGLAEVLPQAMIHAVDCSAEALAIAQRNAERYGLTTRILFNQGIWFEPLASLSGQLSGMVSNPPYIPSQTVLTLQPEVTRHEPHLALDGGLDGLDCIRHLIQVAPTYLLSGGVWLIEMMAGQATAVVPLLEQQGDYRDIQVVHDLAGLDRFVLAHRR